MHRRPRTRRTSRAAAAALVASLAAVLGLTWLLNDAGIPVWSLTADPGPLIEDFHWNTGVLSILGSMLWAVVVALLLCTAAVVRRRGEQPSTAAALRATALVATAWGADDTLLLHDLWLPSVGVHELVVTSVLALVSVLVLWPHRAVLRRTDAALLVLVVLGFAVSTALDAVHVGDAEEDMAKLWALMLLTVWAWRTALQVLAPRPAPAPAARMVSLVDAATGLHPQPDHRRSAHPELATEVMR